MPRSHAGRHELGQNFIRDPAVVGRIVDLAAGAPGPLVEWGTGDGALTMKLAELGRPLHGIDLDARRVRNLSRRVGRHVSITRGDILRHAPPRDSVVVSNVPFHLTTPILRHLLAGTEWRTAILITQWEVARKRSAVGGTTQLTAQWWPWYEFGLIERIPARAFTPQPSVDGGLLTVSRRDAPLVRSRQRQAYQAWVAAVFSSRGRGLVDILRRNGVPERTATDISRHTRSRRPLPRDLRADEWSRAYLATRTG